MLKAKFAGLFLILGTSVWAAEPVQISLPLIPHLQRANLYVSKLTPHPSAVLVLSPGFNGNGKEWIENPVWCTFAVKHNLALAGLSFASDGEELRQGKGYYYASQGSGQLLLDGLRREVGSDLPLLLYGFSGGAHFTSGFAEWNPKRVMGWCAYSAEWWEPPSTNESSPAGLVICGNEDERLGASLLFFEQGRALGKPWLWITVAHDGHAVSPKAEDFVRDYFASILKSKGHEADGRWVDLDFKTAASHETVTQQPTLTGWLPDSQLLAEWAMVHQP
jgi:hypothetical protein